MSDSTIGLGPGVADTSMSSDNSRAVIYTPAEIGSWFSRLPMFLTSQERATASRAILRRKAHCDEQHHSVRQTGGLHPWYIAVHGNGKGSKEEQLEAIDLLDGSLGDLFDAVSTWVYPYVPELWVEVRCS